MKKIILFIPVLLTGYIGFSQTEKEPVSDTTRIKIGKSIIVIYDDPGNGEYDHDLGECEADSLKKEEHTTMAIDLGMNGYLSSNRNLSMPNGQELMELDYARSRTIGVNIMLKDADIIKDRFYISPGIGINWNNYFFENNISIGTSNDTTIFSADTVVDNDKYKLRATYLQIPVVLGVRIGKVEKPIGLQFGVIGGYKIRSLVKRKYSIDEARYKEKVRDDFNINPFKVDLVARLGYGDFGCFAKYSVTSLFENDKAPELYPFSFGITLGGFTKNSCGS